MHINRFPKRSLSICLLSILSLVMSSFGQETNVSQPEQSALTPAENPQESKEILVDNFDEGETEGVYYKRKNSLDYYQGSWSKRPSYTLLSKSEVHRRGDHGKGLVLNYKKEGGWCGWYTILGELDVTETNVFSFWVKGDVGGERFNIGFGDSERARLGMDAVYAGPVAQFGKEISTEWQEIKIPISRVSSALDISSLATIVFHFNIGGEGTLYFDDMMFKIDPKISQLEEENLPKAKKSKWYPRSMWVWKVDPVTNVKARDEVIKICKLTATEVIYLFFGEFDHHRDPQYTKMLVEFLADCHKSDLSVEILTGNPTWALKENHDKAYNWLKPFLEFNRTQPENCRFDGVSFDVEPYLAAEWKTEKERVKTEYLMLLRRLRKLIDSYPEQEFHFGGAIPTFYIDEGDFEEEILVLTDYVALMDYYDTADDMIKNADRHLHLAKKLGKKIWIGSEIQDLVSMKQGFRANTFYEEGWEYMEGELTKVKAAFANHPGFGGFAMHCYYAYRQMQKDRTTPHNTIRLEKKKRDFEDKEFSKGDIYSILSFKQTEPLTIDGKLTDWNLAKSFTLKEKKQVVYGSGSWSGKDDLSSKIYSSWDEESLYFAFDIRDDKIVQWKSGESMWMGDHVELWLDIDLGDDFTEASNSNDDFQIGLSPGNFDDLKPEVHVWVPKVKQRDIKKIRVGSSKSKIGYTIEVQIPKDAIHTPDSVPFSITDVVESKSSGRKQRHTQKKKGNRPTQFFQGYQIGIMADVSDTDSKETPQKCLMSSSLDRRWGDPTVFGFLELRGSVDEEIEAGFFTKGPEIQHPEDETSGELSSEVASGENIASTHDTAEKLPSVDKDRFVRFEETPEIIINEGTYLYDLITQEDEKKASRTYRGKLGAYQLEPNSAATVEDITTYFDPAVDSISNYSEFVIENPDQKSIKCIYDNVEKESFCGSYVLIMADLSAFTTLTFLVKGTEGGEMFEIGMNDAVSHKREDAVYIGSITRYLPDGITSDWQLVSIPLKDFYGPDLSRVYSLSLLFHEIGRGTFWIDEICLSGKTLQKPKEKIEETGYLLLDDFDHSNLNLLGRKTATYKNLPTFAIAERVVKNRFGEKGRSLKLTYSKKNTGWGGYYSLLNQIDGDYYDLSQFTSVSFWVRGESGGEDFEIGLADKNWQIIGDSLKAGQISKYLPGGLTKKWQHVEIPLKDFGPLDLTEMGSFAINFNVMGDSAIYLDNLKFHLSEQITME